MALTLSMRFFFLFFFHWTEFKSSVEAASFPFQMIETQKEEKAITVHLLDLAHKCLIIEFIILFMFGWLIWVVALHRSVTIIFL